MNTKILVTLVIAVLAFCGCEKKDDSATRQIEQLSQQFQQLKTQVEGFTNRLSKLDGQVFLSDLNISTTIDRVNNFAKQISQLERNSDGFSRRLNNLELDDDSASITTEPQGSQTLKTPVGNLLFSTKKVEPYLDGYKITAQIGNPTTADIANFDLILTTYKNITNNFETLHSVTNNIVTELKSGSWNYVDFVMAPATIEEVRNATVSIKAKTFSLRSPPAP